MNKWATILFGLVCGLLAAGVILLVSMPPRGEPVRLQPPPTPGPLTVHVTGAVANPGVYTLPLEARVQDALDAAGGVTTGADTTSLNLAARLQDGERVYIPLTSQEQPSDTGGASAGGNGEVGALLVDLNTANSSGAGKFARDRAGYSAEHHRRSRSQRTLSNHRRPRASSRDRSGDF